MLFHFHVVFMSYLFAGMESDFMAHIVYILDRDFNDVVPTDFDYYTIDGGGVFDIFVYKSRVKLLDAIKNRSPDILLFDLYAKYRKTDPNNSSSYDESCASCKIHTGNDCVCDDSVVDNQNAVDSELEKALVDLQNKRDRARKIMKANYYPAGLHDVEWLLNEDGVNFNFPMAIFSRYGRLLLSTENVLKLQKNGIYFVWKDKDADDIYGRGLHSREQDSILEVITAYRDNSKKISSSFYFKMIEFENSKTKMNKLVKKYKRADLFFSAAIIFTAIVNLKCYLSPELAKFAQSVIDSLFIQPMSIVAGVSAVAYLVMNKILGYSYADLHSIHGSLESIFNDLIAAGKQNNKQ